METQYSVLMSVYYKEKPEYLKEAMQSMFDQTVPTNDLVLVCDGPLNVGLDEVINEMQEKHIDVLHVYRLEKNQGLGNALNFGLKHCRNELVARMDSDDISRKDRCERQLKIFENNPEISICSGTVEEFSDNKESVDALRVVPETNEEIIEFAKKRNPFNHPCVMYKKSAVEAAGNYQDFYLLEDYYLWVRMILKKYKGYNIQNPLLSMRAGSDMYKRRAGWNYTKSQRKLLLFMRNHGMIEKKLYIKNCVIRSIASLIPNMVRKLMFEKVLRQ